MARIAVEHATGDQVLNRICAENAGPRVEGERMFSPVVKQVAAVDDDFDVGGELRFHLAPGRGLLPLRRSNQLVGRGTDAFHRRLAKFLHNLG